jgi:LAO/AO transport system kinase
VKVAEMELVKRMLAGEMIALAQLINLAEIDSTELPEIMKLIHPYLGKAYRIGITGGTGVGKSTIVDKLTTVLRKQGFTVGIICVDPSSSFSGGALLGDRVRMCQHFWDEGVFIRSMAGRGRLGGLPGTISPVIKLLDAFGRDFILIETVGVGQCELDVTQKVDAVVVVLNPGTGDAIQIMKAGLLEVANIIVVNKGDHPGVHNLVAELQATFQAKQIYQEIPVVVTEAINNKGITELWEQIKRYKKLNEEGGQFLLRRQQQRRHEFMEILEHRVIEESKKFMAQSDQLTSYLGKVERGEVDPYSASRKALPALIKKWKGRG